jgi:hypothetical protein
MADTKDRMNIDEDPKFKKFLDSDQYPRDLKLMHSILKGMSVTDYDPKVPQQMYEFMHSAYLFHNSGRIDHWRDPWFCFFHGLSLEQCCHASVNVNGVHVEKVCRRELES